MHEMTPERGVTDEPTFFPARPSLRIGALVCALLGLAVGYAGTLHTLWRVWLHNPNYSHGFLIPPITVWLLIRQRAVCAEAAPCGSWRGSILLIPAVFLQIIAIRGDVAMLQGIALIASIMGIVWQLFGGRVFRAAAFPLAFLLFMIPALPWFMDVASFRLKVLAAHGAVEIARAMGLAVQREGVNLLLPEGVLAVENACSGLRSLIALLALGALFAYLSKGAIWRRIVLFGLALPIAVIANILRISALCIYAGLAGVEQAAGLFHDIGGYAHFAFAFLMLAGSRKVLRC